MIQSLKRIWAERTELERLLLGLLTLALVCLVLVGSAWRRHLVPFAAEYGTYAEWIAAGATVLGFGSAVYTLRWNAREETKRRRAVQRAEASRVVLTWDDEPRPLTGEMILWIHKATLHNSGSSPIQNVFIAIAEVAGGTLETSDPVHPWQYEAIAPNTTRDIEVLMRWKPSATPSNVAINEAMVYCFVDVEDELWMHNELGLSAKGSTTPYRKWWVERRHERTKDPLPPHVREKS